MSDPAGFVPAVVAFDFAATAADVGYLSGYGLLMGWALEETTGAAVARVVLRDGQTVGAPVLAPVTLAANESTREWFAPYGIVFERGVFLDLTAGNIAGALYLALGARPGDFLRLQASGPWQL